MCIGTRVTERSFWSGVLQEPLARLERSGGRLARATHLLPGVECPGVDEVRGDAPLSQGCLEGRGWGEPFRLHHGCLPPTPPVEVRGRGGPGVGARDGRDRPGSGGVWEQGRQGGAAAKPPGCSHKGAGVMAYQRHQNPPHSISPHPHRSSPLPRQGERVEMGSPRFHSFLQAIDL